MLQLLLDPFYRTLTGFATLVEREWVSFGHKFHDRTQGMGAAWKGEESAPIFVQWLDVVQQVGRSAAGRA